MHALSLLLFLLVTACFALAVPSKTVAPVPLSALSQIPQTSLSRPHRQSLLRLSPDSTTIPVHGMQTGSESLSFVHNDSPQAEICRIGLAGPVDQHSIYPASSLQPSS
jgi:hypothetical protein